MEGLKKYLEYLHKSLINQNRSINILEDNMIKLCETMEQSSRNNVETLGLLADITNLIKEQQCT